MFLLPTVSVKTLFSGAPRNGHHKGRFPMRRIQFSSRTVERLAIGLKRG
jgi:hypothetical protein